MNKLLTTITLLCFSVAANADIYFCNPVHARAIFATAVVGNINILLDDDRFIVDTEKGFRSNLSTVDDYSASCEIDRKFVQCGLKHELGDWLFAINIEDLTFSYTAVRLGRSVSSWVGTCIKA